MEATKSNLRFAFIYNSKRDVVVFALSLPELGNYIHLLYEVCISSGVVGRDKAIPTNTLNELIKM